MRPHRLLLLPLTAILALGAAAPAMAADAPVGVPDFVFVPSDVQIAVGDRVTWTFTDDVSHTTTSDPNQADSWDSGLKANGEPYSRTFTKPGKFGYFCELHTYMTGSVTVGEDTVAKTVKSFKTKKRGQAVYARLTLNEAATQVRLKLKGPSKRTIERSRLKAGRHAFRLRNLKPGKYRATLTLRDDFDKKAAAKRSFRVG